MQLDGVLPGHLVYTTLMRRLVWLLAPGALQQVLIGSCAEVGIADDAHGLQRASSSLSVPTSREHKRFEEKRSESKDRKCARAPKPARQVAKQLI